MATGYIAGGPAGVDRPTPPRCRGKGRRRHSACVRIDALTVEGVGRFSKNASGVGLGGLSQRATIARRGPPNVQCRG